MNARIPPVLALASIGVILAPLFGTTVLAQAVGSGSVQGRVTDTDGQPIHNAVVHVGGSATRTSTDDYGRFIIRGVPGGARDVTVSYLGYQPETATVVVQPGQVTQADVRLAVAPIALQGIVVEGQLEGQARALNQQRGAAHIVNVISREQIDQFPNTSATDALRRVPGVSFPGSQELNSGMHIRGLGPGFSSVRVDGERVPSTGYTGERSTNTNMLLSESIELMEVNKAITPDMPADAVGGSVNIRTRRPRGDRQVLTAKVTVPHSGISSRTGYEVAGTYGAGVGPLRFVLNGSRIRDYENEERFTTRWAEQVIESGASVMPSRIEWADYDSENIRSFVNAVVDYEVNERNAMWLRAGINHDRKLSYSPWNSVGFSEYATAGGLAQASASSYSRYRDWNRRLQRVALGGESVLPRANVSYSISYSQARLRLPTYLQPEFASEPFEAVVDVSDRRFPSFQRVAGADPSDGAAYQLVQIRDFPRLSEDRDATASLDIEIPFNAGPGTAAVKVGGKFLTKRTWADLKPIRWSSAPEGDLPLSQFTHRYQNSDHFDGRHTFYPAADGEKVMDHMATHPEAFAEQIGYTASLEVEEYDARENVSALYAMGTLNLGRWSLVGGGRLEHTDFRNRGGELVYDENGEYAGITDVYQRNSYLDIYPNVHLRYRATDNTNLRTAFSTGLARPRLYDMTPYAVVEADRQEVSRGNPDLEPSYSWNLDLLFDHYMQQIGVLSAGLFFKDVQGFILERTFEETEGPHAGWMVTQPENGDGAKVYGAEVNWQQRLTFLPGALNGFGIYANYTYTRSRAELANAERRLPLPDAIPHVFNIALTYDRAGTSGSLSLNRIADYLENVGSSPETDRYFRNRTQLDLILRQRVLGRASVYAEIANLTNASFGIYEGSADFMTDQRMIGWSGRIGVHYEVR